LQANQKKFNLLPLNSTNINTMSWFSFGSSTAGPKSAKASDGGRIAPDRSSREVCYTGRDLFFSCLDRNDILDAIKHDSEARKKCGKEIAEFESACSKAWVCLLSHDGSVMN
jgi:cytochrome c oxidase assembly factor 6